MAAYQKNNFDTHTAFFRGFFATTSNVPRSSLSTSSFRTTITETWASRLAEMFADVPVTGEVIQYSIDNIRIPNGLETPVLFTY